MLCLCAVVRRDWHLVLQDLERDLRVFYLTNVPLVCPVSQRATAGTYSGFEGACVTRVESPHRVDFVRLAVTSSLFFTRLAWLFIDPTALLDVPCCLRLLP